MSRVLIVEDEHRFATFLEKGLRANGFATTTVDRGEKALAVVSEDDFDLMLLDLGLPDVDGQEVLVRLRRRGDRTPVIVLTARDDVGDKITGLDGGADDYVTKPFRLDELLARIRVRLRSSGAAEVTVLEAGSIRLDLRSRRAVVADRTVELTAREFTTLETLMRHAGQVLSREQLLSHVWGYGYDPGSNVVEVYIGHLRRKLGSDAVHTVRGMGYRVG